MEPNEQQRLRDEWEQIWLWWPRMLPHTREAANAQMAHIAMESASLALLRATEIAPNADARQRAAERAVVTKDTALTLMSAGALSHALRTYVPGSSLDRIQ